MEGNPFRRPVRRLALEPCCLQQLVTACLIACVAANDCAILRQLASCAAAADVAQVRAPSPLLMQLYRHAVSSRIGLGKLSTLPSVSDLGREEGGDCGGEKKVLVCVLSRNI